MKRTGTHNSTSTAVARGARRPASHNHISGAEEAPAAGTCGGERPTSSVPRGRSSNSSDRIKIYKDSSGKRSDIGGRSRLVSSARKTKDAKKLSEIKDNNLTFGFGSVKKAVPIHDKCQKIDGKDKHFREPGEKHKNVLKDIHDSSKIGLGLKVCNVQVIKSDGLRKSWESSTCKVVDMDCSREKRFSDEGLRTRVGVKNTSKLHEKLAFLEGKVKRIALDIKKTKEMLDLSNTDSSKVMLLDIQNKISGIEKVMGRVTEGRLESSVHVSEEKPVDVKKMDDNDAKCSIKSLSKEDLEARLFPHQKLLRDRLTSKLVHGGCKEDDGTDVIELSGNIQKKPLTFGLFAAKSIENEFLNTIDDTEVNSTKDNVDAKFCESDESGESADSAGSTKNDSTSNNNELFADALLLSTEETLDDLDGTKKTQLISVEEERDEAFSYKLKEVGTKICSGGWFVSEGESALLAHDDGSCTLHDIVNNDEKVVYKPPEGISPNIWADCWVIRAHGADGSSEKYVVAASAGNSMNSGFCSWDFYSKDIRAFYTENVQLSIATSRVLCPLSSNTTFKRNSLSNIMATDSHHHPWYKPCGTLIISASGAQRSVKIFDIRDAEQLMEWQMQKPLTTMDYSCPLQWRNRDKVIVAEAERLSVWDVNGISACPLNSIPFNGRKICALHIVNTDAEVGGGVRQRVSSAEAEGNDGVFCTADTINVLDFRLPSGVGLKIPKIGYAMQSLYTRGDSIYVGCNKLKLSSKNQQCPQVLQFSIKKQKQVGAYSLPESNVEPRDAAITQVWGNSEIVMASSGQGLFVFDGLEVAGSCSSQEIESGFNQQVKEILGPDDLYHPTFDYSASQALLISKDRPALWRTIVKDKL